MINTSVRACQIPMNNDFYKLLSWLNLFNTAAVPFFLMTLMSIILIVQIFRRRVISNKVTNSMAKARRDIRFSFLILLMNFSFILLNLPLCVYLVLAKYDSLFFLISIELAFANTVVPFFIYIFANSKFRRELLTLFGNFVCLKC